MSVTPKSLVLDLLSTLPAGASVPVGALVRAAAVLGVGDNNLRVALTRLRAQGLVTTAGRGHYRLGSAAAAIDQRLRSWYALEDSVTGWDGAWLAVEVGKPGKPGKQAQPRAHAHMLRLLGLRPLSAALHVRPDNLSDGAEHVRARLRSLDAQDATLVFRMSDLDPIAETRARGLWDASALEAGYAQMVETLQDSAARLGSLPRQQAMAESFLLGGEALRMIVTDPLLPAPIVDVDARRRLVETMRSYRRLGLQAWSSWAGDSITLQKSPTDAWRHAAGAGHTPAAGG